MLKKGLLATAITCFALPAFAAETEELKHFSVGVASYATTLRAETDYGSDDLDFGGFAVFGTGAINDNVGFRLTYADQDSDDDSDLESTAVEGSLIAGTGLATSGFKAYGSVGFFSETWEVSGFSGEEDFSGLMLGAGIGYNWSPVSLELWVNLRDASDYEDFAGSGVDITAASGGLGLSARF